MIRQLKKKPGVERQVWQASIWSGPTPEVLTESIIYGDSLSTLRSAASSWLYEHRPDCFSNVPSWSLRQPILSALPRSLWALYMLRQVRIAPSVPDALSVSPQQGNTITSGKRKRGRLAEPSRMETEGTPSPLSSEVKRASETEEERSHATQTQDCPLQLNWHRMGVNDDGRESATLLLHANDAVYYFLHQDLLITRGPDFREQAFGEAQRDGLQFRGVKTVKVVDDEEIANNMLYRGGWSLLRVLGKLAPARKDKTVLFVLGHVEEYAV